MKKTTQQISLLLLGFMVAFTGCDTAEKAVNEAKDKAADLANIDFGDFNLQSLQDKFAGITDGFKNVTTDNVDGLTSKISELSGSIDGMGIDKLAGPAKTAVSGLISTFGDAIKSAMGGISDEGLLAKLKPVVDILLEKLGAF